MLAKCEFFGVDLEWAARAGWQCLGRDWHHLRLRTASIVSKAEFGDIIYDIHPQ
jgi:hypothetical protein